MYGADVKTFGGWGKAASGLPLRQCGRWSQRAHEHTSTRAHEHTSTRAHEHTSTRAHDTQPIPPQINLTIRGSTSPCHSTEIRHQDTPRCASLPRRPTENASPHTTTQAPTVGSIIPAAHTKKGRALPTAPQKTHHPTPPRPNRSPLHPKHPMSPRFHRGGLHFEQPYGRFRTIDPSTGTRRWPFRATTRGVLRP